MRWQDLMRHLAGSLSVAGLSDPEREALYLLEWATGRRYADWVVQGGTVSPDEIARAERGLDRRLRREPMAYIVGRREFYGLDLRVGPDVLVPRPETEVLVEAVLSQFPNRPLAAADVGTGSGAIALALKAMRPAWTVFGSDVSDPALMVARANGEHLGLDVVWIAGHLLSGVSTLVDVVVANLPYVDPQGSVPMSPETAYEPSLALYADNGGMAVMAQLLTQVPEHLRTGGWAFLECSPEQVPALVECMQENGFSALSVTCDYAGLERVVRGCFTP